MMQAFHMDTEQPKNNNQTIAVWAITPNGVQISANIHKHLDGSVLFVSKKLQKEIDCKSIGFNSLSKEIQNQFNSFTGHIFIFSTGISVRMIAPLIESKLTDPAVVVVDDNATHAISLLSGHIGGANQLTHQISDITGATPVITTATDTNKVPAIDMIAKEKNLYIETPETIKLINMAFLNHEPVHLDDPLLILANSTPSSLWTAKTKTEDKINCVVCSHKTDLVSRETLVLRPPVLSIGIGCNRGTSKEEIKNFLTSVLEKESLSEKSIFRLATTEVKKDEQGLLELAKEMNLPIDFYTKEELNSVTTIVSPSKMVEKHLGVKSVCEASAILTAGNGKLIVTKQKNKDVTIAVAIKR